VIPAKIKALDEAAERKKRLMAKKN